jgi:hypothetical protein
LQQGRTARGRCIQRCNKHSQRHYFHVTKKNEPYDIEIVTLRKRSYALDVKSRDKLRGLLAEHDKAAASTRPQIISDEPDASA